jgi:hypothetical protein
MQGYTDTILVDCNRLNSEEKKAGNKTTPAIFTNKIGTGLKLNVGDKVSVHSGFISERGAGGGVIELTGKVQKSSYSLTETTIGKFQPRYVAGEQASRYGQLQPFGHHCVTQTPTTKTYTLQDNIGHIQINYYKTTNGEGYFHLPRRFDAKKLEFTPVPIDRSGKAEAVPHNANALYNNAVPLPPGWFNLFNNNAGNNRTPHNNGQLDDRYDNGRVKTNYMYDYARCNADVNYYFDPSRDQFDGTPEAESSRFWKKKNNNSRYTLFVKEVSYFAEWRVTGKYGGHIDNIKYDAEYEGSSTLNDTRSRDDYESSAGLGVPRHPRDPALSQYNRYTEIKEINIDTLHSAPENIADAVTNQLNKITTDEHIRGEVGGTFKLSGDGTSSSYVGDIRRDPTATYDSAVYPYYGTPILPPANPEQSLVGVNIARRLESECMKTFACANPLTFSQEYYEAYWKNGTADPDATTLLSNNIYGDQDKVQNYLSSYTTIGIKRPDFFEELRNVAALSPGKSGGVALDGVGVAGEGNSWRNMYCPWVMNGAVINTPQTPTSEQIKGSTRATADIILSYEWNETNLQALKKYFDVQGKYPDLWDYNGGNAGQNNSIIKQTGLTPDNSRFWHMNATDGQTDTDNENNLIGNDNYENAPGTAPTTGVFTNEQSIPLFFYFDKTRSDIARGGGNANDLYYGMFIKRRAYFPDNSSPANFYDCIGVTMENVGGTPDYFFNQSNIIDNGPSAPADGDVIGDSYSRAIGVDIHFNAYGTDAICLYTGILDAPGQDEAGTESPYTNRGTGGWANQVYYEHDEARGTKNADGSATKDQGYYMTSIQIRERYCGAISPALSFDTSASRFNFKALHTPENIGNNPQAGYPSTTDSANNDIPIVSGAGDIAIKINKRLFKTSYCPDMIPYENPYTASFFAEWAGDEHAGVADADNAEVTPYNTNLEKWCPYDADGGIQISSFGLSEDQWDNSLWGILGFSYDQFNNPNTLSTQTRMLDGTDTKDIGLLTTNSVLSAGEIKKFTTNINGGQLYNMDVGVTPVGLGPMVNYYDQEPLLPHNSPSPPAITISQGVDNFSTQINASNLPRKMIRPYFLIKSNIVGNVNYLGGEDSGQSLPVVYIVNKENGFGDFYFQSESQNEFTITKDVVLSSITTSIHEADYSLASVDENSAIIYKITKQVQANMNVAAEVMAELQKKK